MSKPFGPPLAAYKPEPPLVSALNKAETVFGAIQGEFDEAARQEFTSGLKSAQEMAAGELGEPQKKLLTLKLDSLINLLVIYGIEADHETMAALTQAKGLV